MRGRKMVKDTLLIEVFYGGSHKQLADLIYNAFSERIELITLPAKKWHWRSLVSPLQISEKIPRNHNFRILFTSSVLPLAELVAIRPDLSRLHKIVYFHENQLNYPVRNMKSRYFNHGYNELLACLTADKVVFNSRYNMDSFLTSLPSYFNIIPDFKPNYLVERIKLKSSVVHFPLLFHSECKKVSNICHDDLPEGNSSTSLSSIENLGHSEDPLHIVWPHRWEHDKNPDAFFSVMFRLKDEGLPFRLSVIGEKFSEIPKIFDEAVEYLKGNIVHWGFVESKDNYFAILYSSDIAVSTSEHEFFGVSMLEATSCGCYPLCPNKLVYPEIYPEECLYNTTNQLYKRLKYLCKRPGIAQRQKAKVNIEKYSWETLKKDYETLLAIEEKEESKATI